MDFAGQDVLAGAVFAGDEYGGVGWSDFPERIPDGVHGLRCAPVHQIAGRAGNDVSRHARPISRHARPISRHARPRSGISPHRLPRLVPGRCEGADEFFVVPGLYDEIEGAAFHSLHGQLDIGIGGKEDDLHVRNHLLDFSGPVEAFVAGVDAGVEVHVQQHDVRTEAFKRRHQGGRRRDGLHRFEGQRQEDFQRLADSCVVIHNQDFSFLCCHKIKRIYTFSLSLASTSPMPITTCCCVSGV